MLIPNHSLTSTSFAPFFDCFLTQIVTVWSCHRFSPKHLFYNRTTLPCLTILPAGVLFWMADDALVWLTQVCPWQATVWQRALASQQVAVQWQAEGTWQRSWSEMPRLWLLDVAATGEEVAVCCQWWRTHCPQVPLGLIDSRQSEVTAAQHSEVQRWGALGLLPGFDRAHITRSVAANLRQVLAWLGLGDFDKARLVPVLVSLATLHAPLTQVQPVPEQSQTHAQPAPSPPVVPSSDPVVRRYRGAVVLPSGASPPTPVVKLRYRGAEVVPPHPSPPEPVVTPSSDLPIPPPHHRPNVALYWGDATRFCIRWEWGDFAKRCWRWMCNVRGIPSVWSSNCALAIPTQNI